MPFASAGGSVGRIVQVASNMQLIKPKQQADSEEKGKGRDGGWSGCMHIKLMLVSAPDQWARIG